MDKCTKQNQAAYDTGANGWARAMAAHATYKYLEKSAMEALLPGDLTGKTVLCIGAGSGEELGAIVARNPLSVMAIDISENLLTIARAHFPDVECKPMDMMRLEFPDATFDLIYSSLVFHYTQDWDALLSGVRRVLKPGATLLFSTHNPDYWAKHPTGASVTNARGMKLTEHTATVPGGVEIVYYNHPSTHAIDEAVQHAGFTILGVRAPEVRPVSLQQLASTERKKYVNLVQTNKETPLFYVVWAVKCAETKMTCGSETV